MSNYSDTQQPVVEMTDETVEYWAGYEMYFEGFLLSEMQSQYEEFGWWEAWQHEDETDDYEEWMLEIEWIREGC